MTGCIHDPIGGPCDACDPPPPREPFYSELEAEIVALRAALSCLVAAVERDESQRPGLSPDCLTVLLAARKVLMTEATP